MDKRVLIGVGGVVAIILVVGLVLGLTGGDGEDDDVADDASPTQEVAEEGNDETDTSETDQENGATEEPESTDGGEGSADEDESSEEDGDGEEPPESDEGEGEEGDTSEGEDGDPATGDESQQPQSEDMAYGFNIAWRGDEGGAEYNQQTRQSVEDAGFNWVRFQVRWSDVQRERDWLDPLPVDRMIEEYEGTDTKILVSVVDAPEWALDPDGEQLLEDWESFVGFMAFMANRYQGQVDAWEIWNEQNLAHEMNGTVRVSDYAHLLEAGYRGVKDADPEALVVFGGLTPTGVNDESVAVNDVEYLEDFYLYGNGFYTEFFDVMGMHLNATNNPPDTSYPDNPGPGEWSDHNSFYFLRGVDLRNKMEQFEDDRPVWITEFGWTTENQAEGYEYGADVSEEDQAEYLTQSFETAREQMPWVNGMFVWNLNFSTLVPEEDEKHAWSVLNEDWSPRPAYEALQDMEKP